MSVPIPIVRLAATAPAAKSQAANPVIQRVIELIRIPSSRLVPTGYEGRPIESEKNNALRQSCNKTQPDPDASTGGFDRAFLAA